MSTTKFMEVSKEQERCMHDILDEGLNDLRRSRQNSSRPHIPSVNTSNYATFSNQLNAPQYSKHSPTQSSKPLSSTLGGPINLTKANLAQASLQGSDSKKSELRNLIDEIKTTSDNESYRSMRSSVDRGTSSFNSRVGKQANESYF